MAAKRVEAGGMFHSPTVKISKETQDLLKLMMEESKLTNFQRRTLITQAQGGKSLPVRCNPSTSKVTPTTKANKISTPIVMNGKHLSMSAGKRTKDTIEMISKENPPGKYRPSPAKLITEADKRKLQNRMAYGKEIPDVVLKKCPVTPPVEQYDNIDEFDQILEDIEERRQFLQEMESLGQGKKYRTQIQTEISQKIRELEVIDKKRSKELATLLQEQNQT